MAFTIQWHKVLYRLALCTLLLSVWTYGKEAQVTDLVGPGSVKRAFTLETFIDTYDVDQNQYHVELRQSCCHANEQTARSFCDEFVISEDDCAILRAYLDTTMKDVSRRDCSPTSCNHTLPDKLGTFHVHINDHATSSNKNLKLAVHRGDLYVLTERKKSICKLVAMGKEACLRFHRQFEKFVVELELGDAKTRILQHGHSEQRKVMSAIGTYERAIQILQKQNRELEEIVQEKALAYSTLYWKAAHTNSEQERQIRHLEQKIRQLEELQLNTASNTQKTATIDSAITKNDAIVENSHTTFFHRNSRHIPRLAAASCSYDQYKEYAKNATPVIFTGFQNIAHTPGLPPWSVKTLRNICGDQVVTLKSHRNQVGRKSDQRSRDPNQSSSPTSRSMWAGLQTVAAAKLSYFLDDFENPDTQEGWPMTFADLYLHDMSIAKFCPQLLESLYVPRFFTHDKLQAFESSQRDYWPSLFIGNVSTLSALHADWGATAAWMGLIQGKKHWVITKPSTRAALNELNPTTEFPTTGRYDADLMSESSPSTSSSLLHDDEIFEDILEEGEVLYIPANCPHQVRNLGKTIAVAVNFVDDVNADEFAAFLQRERDSSIGVDYAIHAEWLQTVQHKRLIHKQENELRDLAFHEFKAQQWQ